MVAPSYIVPENICSCNRLGAYDIKKNVDAVIEKCQHFYNKPDGSGTLQEELIGLTNAIQRANINTQRGATDRWSA